MRMILLAGIVALSGCITASSKGTMEADAKKGTTETTGAPKGWSQVEFVNRSDEPLKFFIDDRMQLELPPGGQGAAHCRMGKRKLMAVAPNGNHISDIYEIGKLGLVWTVTN